MLKRLLAVALLALVAYPASAAMNIRQKGDGTATWEGRTADWRFQNCVGGHTLSVLLPKVSDLSTGYTVVPVTNALIHPMYSVINGSVTGVSQLEFYVNQTTTPVRFHNTVTGLLTNATINVDTGSGGAVDRVSEFGEVGANALSDNAAIEGAYIAVQSDGGGSGNVSGTVLLRACPR